MRFIFYFSSRRNFTKLNYVDRQDARRGESKEFSVTTKTFFRVRSFHPETLVTCPLPFLASEGFFSSLELGSFVRYISPFPPLYYDVPSLFLVLVRFPFFATLQPHLSHILGVSSPFSRTILPILSSPSRVPSCLSDLIFLACCLTSVP